MRRRHLLAAVAFLLALCAGVLLWTRRAEVAVRGPELAAPAVAPPAPGPGEVAVERSPGAPDRVALPDPAAPEPDPPVEVATELEHPFVYLLAVRTVDELGFPLGVESLRLAPACSDLVAARPLGTHGGWAAFLWRGKAPEMDVDVQWSGTSALHGSRRVRVRAGSPCEVALLGSAVRDAGAAPFVLRLQLDGTTTVRGFASAGTQPLAFERFPHPHARFAARVVGAAPAAPAEAPVPAAQPAMPGESVILSPLEARGRLVNLQLGEEEVRRLIATRSQLHVTGELRGGLLRLSHGEVPAGEGAGSRLAVHVVDEQGRPAAGVLVALGRAVDGRELETSTDAQGSAVFESVPDGWWEARAGGGAAGLARTRLLAQAPAGLAWNAALDPGARIVGRVLDAAGNPAAGAVVRYESTPDVRVRATAVRLTLETRGGEEVSERGDDSAAASDDWRAPWVDETTTRDDGTFELANVPGGLGRLCVQLDAGDAGPALVEEGVYPSRIERVLRLPEARGGLRLQVRLPEAAGAGEPPLEVRAISEATGHGSVFAGDLKYGFASHALAPGWYRVEVGAAWHGWHDLGRHLVEPGARTDLGAFVLPPPARLRVLARATPDLELALYLRRHDLDVRAEPRGLGVRAEQRGLDGTHDLLLPAGEYWVFWRAADGAQRHAPLSLASGARAELDLR